MTGLLQFTLHGEKTCLLPERALYWPRRRTLLIADPHFGKAAAFRAAGIPVPAAVLAGNLRRLSAALARTGAERLLCLGDLLHARAGRSRETVETVGVWREQHRHLEWLLVRGNHDRHAGDPPPEWGVACVDEPFSDAPFVLRHVPEEDPGGYVLAGHVHPAVHVGRGKLAERVACFYFGEKVGILPAFGDFTGTATIRPAAGSQIFVVADGHVLPV